MADPSQIDPPAVSNFLRTIIEQDLEDGTHNGRVATRFPPEPNGYLHIGHAKSICLNFGLALDYDGVCHLRFDDTNPTAEDVEYVEAIQQDVRWLGFDWGEHLYFASDFFEQMYELAVGLIRDGKAYVCSLSEEQIREYRGTVLEPGRPSPYRERSVEENLDLFARMRAGEFEDGAHVLRARVDMAHANMKMRDPLLYRIRHAHHHRTGDDWCIYPMYDYAHPLEDALEDITHSICTLEFENNREVYDWVVQETEVTTSPRQYEFARLHLSNTVMSKRKLLQLVEEGLVAGWDDPRMPTLAGLRRRGVTPEAIRDFAERIGVAKANSLVGLEILEYSIRDDLNAKAPRVMAVLEPLKVVIENFEGETDWIEAPYYPHDVPLEGSRDVPFTREIYIDRSDFMEEPSKKFYRLAPGREVRLRYGYLVTCTGVDKNEAGEVVGLRCTYDPHSRGGNAPDGRKVKGTIHWVSASDSVPAEVRLYDRLFSVEEPGSDERDFRDLLHPDSLRVVQARVEPSVRSDPTGTRYQFERTGYFISDTVDSSPESLGFNRIVSLKDSWAKMQKGAPKKEAPSVVIEKKPKAKKAPKAEVALSPAAETLASGYVKDLGLARADAEILATDDALAAFFESAGPTRDTARPIANWIIHELLRETKEKAIADLPFGGAEIGELVGLIEGGTISGKIGKKVFSEMLGQGGSPSAIVKAKGLVQISSREDLEPIVARIIAENPTQTEQYRGGNERMLGYFVGQVMQATQGKANPSAVNGLLREILA